MLHSFQFSWFKLTQTVQFYSVLRIHDIFCVDPDPNICILLFEGTYFSKVKSQNKSQNSRNQGFSYYIFLIIEGSGSRAASGSGSIPLTNGSGSGSRRPKNVWIRWIRIRNTGFINITLNRRGQLQFLHRCRSVEGSLGGGGAGTGNEPGPIVLQPEVLQYYRSYAAPCLSIAATRGPMPHPMSYAAKLQTG